MTSNGTKLRIVITGAAGRIGKLLHNYLGSLPMYDLVLIDCDSRGDANIHTRTLSSYRSEWTTLFAGADTVIHLAGDPRPSAPWQSVSENNIEATLNVFRALTEHGVRRVIFASTLWTMEGHRFGRGPITADTPPRPISFYAASKLMAEAVGQRYSEERGLSVICLRVGAAQVDRTSPGRDLNAWRRTRWVGGDDICQAFEKSIHAGDVAFAVLPLVSDNSGMRWDLSETRRVIGYEPTKPTPAQPIYLRVRIRAFLGHVYKRLIDPNWRDYRR